MVPYVNVNNKETREDFHLYLIPKILHAWKYKNASVISQCLNNLSKENNKFDIEAIEYWLREYAGFRIEHNLNNSILFHVRMNYRGKSLSPIGHTFTYDSAHLDILKDKYNRYWKVVPVKIPSLKAMHLLEEDEPKSGIPLYEYHKEKVRLSMILNQNSENELERLIENSKTFKNTDHYEYGFISTVAKMTFCFKRTDKYPIGKLLALWMVPAKVKACHKEYMDEYRIEYVLNLAKENRIKVNHF
jgi:hypothetical protein